MTKKYTFFTALLMMLFVALGFAQTPPVNDDCAGALPITIGTTLTPCTPTTVNTTDATTATYTSNCWSTSYDDDVWYSFTATSSTLLIDFTNLSVAAGSIGYSIQASPCASSEITCGSNTAPIAGLTVGTTYYVSLFYVGTTDRGTFDFCISEVSAPANDACTAAISITPVLDPNTCVATACTLIGSTLDSGIVASCSASPVGTIWYSFTANSTTMAAIASNLGSSISSINYGLFSGTCGNLLEVGCGTLLNTTFTNLTIGTTYLLQVSSAQSGTFDLCISAVPPPPTNDNCSGAISYTVGLNQASCNPVSVNTVSATTATYISSCWSVSYDDDVWYSFTAIDTSLNLIFSNLGIATGSIGYSLFYAPCDSTEISCGSDSATLSGLTIGNTYYLSVFYSGTTDVGTFDMCIYANSATPPVNDDCANAINVAEAPNQNSCINTNASTFAATGSTFTSNCSSASYDDDVWYSFTATSVYAKLNISNLSDTTGSIGFSLLSSPCIGTEKTCGVGSSILSGLIIGQKYYLSMFYVGNTKRGSFDFCVYSLGNVGIDEAIENNSFSVSPNPAHSQLNINLTVSVASNVTFSLATIDGREVYSNTEKAFGNYKSTVDVANLSKGVYFLDVTTNKNKLTKKIIIE